MSSGFHDEGKGDRYDDHCDHDEDRWSFHEDQLWDMVRTAIEKLKSKTAIVTRKEKQQQKQQSEPKNQSGTTQGQKQKRSEAEHFPAVGKNVFISQGRNSAGGVASHFHAKALM